MVKFKSKYSYSQDVAACSAVEVVEHEIERSPDYYAGEIESMRAKLQKQTEVICALVSVLSEEVQVQLVEKVAPWWKPADA